MGHCHGVNSVGQLTDTWFEQHTPSGTSMSKNFQRMLCCTVLKLGVHSATQWQWHHEIGANLAHQTIVIVYHERDLFISYV